MADFKCFSCSVPKVNSEFCQASMTAQKMKFSVKDFISKCDQIHFHFLCSDCYEVQIFFSDSYFEKGYVRTH